MPGVDKAARLHRRAKHCGQVRRSVDDEVFDEVGDEVGELDVIANRL